ncbi:hypothetical protein H8B08_12610 [Caulobacter sp. 17J80-11]|nr:hypothetical protein [Caulobacter sp. 17J80-11]
MVSIGTLLLAFAIGAEASRPVPARFATRDTGLSFQDSGEDAAAPQKSRQKIRRDAAGDRTRPRQSAVFPDHRQLL